MDEQELISYCRNLMDGYGLDDWTFKLNRGKHRYGYCNYKTKTISISKYFVLAHETDTRNTILHEIAHALVGRDSGHNHRWREVCIEIGGNGQRVSPIFNFSKKYEVWCPDCEIMICKRDKKTNGGMCKKCKAIVEWVEVN